ncbi:MAG: hypothetical protein LCH73_10190 [Proteobacteria bacterium]|nr:hypothetical protein [Pseudomonadota bacterium]
MDLPVAAATPQKELVQVATKAVVVDGANQGGGQGVNPWALAGLLFAVMALGVARRRHS